MNSIWTDVSLPRFPKLAESVATDVLIIGGGMAGLLSAWELRRRGVDCLVVEAGCIAGGITKNTTAKITSQHGLIYKTLTARFGSEAAGLYLRANEEALGVYKKLCSGIDCDFALRDNYIYSRNDRGVLEQELAALQAIGSPAEFAKDLPLPFPTAGAVKFPDQAQFHPLKFLAGILPGLKIYEYTPVRQLAKNTAVTDGGTIEAKAIIVATHFPFLNKHGSFFLKLYQQRSYAIALKGAQLPRGMYLEEKENGLSLRTHGDTLILGGGGHRTGKEGGGWRELEAQAESLFPGAAITHRWATQDCMSLDGMPYIGRYSPMTENLYVATGFNKWGMTSSMMAARVLADLLQGKENPYAELFSPSRSMLHPQLGINMLESTRNILTPTVPRCPHLGCALKWNKQEHSWDCPCHGSRFTPDGQLIDNPATGGLRKRE